MKQWLKAVAEMLARLAVLPVWILYRIETVIWEPTRAFPGWSQLFALLPGLVGIYLRRAFYWYVLPRCGANVCINFGTVFSHPTAEIGDNVYIGAYCCLGDVTLHDDVLLGSHISIPNGGAQHGITRVDIPIRLQPGTWPRITIGADSWLGDRAVVLADVGAHAVVGAGAVVSRPIPPFAIAVGVPARVIRNRVAPSDCEQKK